MTLSARTSIASITYAVPEGSASSGTTYNITYNFLNNDEFVNVWYRNSNSEKIELVLDSDFKIDVSSGTNNVYGLVVLLRDIADITSITLERSISISQDIDFNNNTLYPNITEYAFDKLTAISQDQNFKSYTIHAPSDETVTDPRKFELPAESERLNKIVGFNGQGRVAMYDLPEGGIYRPATRDSLGLVIIGDNLSLTAAGLINVSIASEDDFGLVQIGSGVTVNDGVISVDLPGIATADTLGLVKIGDKLNIDGTGLLDVPVASASTFGVVKVGSGVNINDGVISVDTYAPATTDTLGLVKIGDKLTIDGTGLLNVPVASTSTFGVVKVGTGIGINDGVISVDTSTIRQDAETAATNASAALAKATIAKSTAEYASDLAEKTADLFDWYIDTPWTITNIPATGGVAGAYGSGKFVIAHTNYYECDYSTSISSSGITWERGTLPATKNWKDVSYGHLSAGVTWTTATTPPSGIYYRGVTVENGRYVAVGHGHASYSTDGGVTWTAATTRPSGSYYYGVTVENGRYVTVGYSRAAYSTDGGVTWTAATTLPTGTYYGVTVENGRYVAVGNNVAAYSTDGGVHWTVATTLPTGTYYGVTVENGRYVAVGSGGAAYSTDGGVTWTSATTRPSGVYYGVTVENGRYVTVGSGGAAYSTDGGVNWTPATTPPPSGTYRGVIVENGRYVAVGYNNGNAGIAAYSTDGGVNWTPATTPPSGNYYYGVTVENGRYVAVGYNNGNAATAAYSYDLPSFVMVAFEGNIAYSPDAQTWQNALVNAGYWRLVAYKDDVFAAIGDSHYAYSNDGGANWATYSITWGATPLGIVTSDNNFFVVFQDSRNLAISSAGDSWFTSLNALPGNIEVIGYGNGKLVALKNLTVYYSENEGSTWTTVTLPNTVPSGVVWAAIAYGGNRYVAIAKDGTVVYSSDAVTWHVSRYPLPTATDWCDLVYGKGTFLAINSVGILCAFKVSIDIVDLLEGMLA